MIKRITLLRRREDMLEADFRKHWAEPHAEIAKGFEGLRRYNQNRVDRICWQTGDVTFHVDGIVELWFASQDAVRRNATSHTTAALTKDEPNFLSGLTALSVGETWISSPAVQASKYIVLACAADPDGLCRAIKEAIPKEGDDMPAEFTLDKLTPVFTREALWSEPTPPDIAVTIWMRTGAADIVASTESALLAVFASEAEAAMAYEIDELRIV